MTHTARAIFSIAFRCLLCVLLPAVWAPRLESAEEYSEYHFRCESAADGVPDGVSVNGGSVNGVQWSTISSGDLIFPNAVPNAGSWQFDGQSAIAYAMPGNVEGFEQNFTWEGFFLSPASNSFLAETGIADRLVTQFAFDQGDWTRLAIGLVADHDGLPRLSVELEGFEGRSFGMGTRTVAPDRWHHFALVHEGTSAAAHIRWYLDYEIAGELFLGGQSNQNTLRPPGAARFAIGARLLRDGQVNRGFHGWIDEVRLSSSPLSVDQFLRCRNATFSSVVSSQRGDIQARDRFWQQRHLRAAELAMAWSPKSETPRSIDGFLKPATGSISDAAFLRRLSLAIRGRIPHRDEVRSFLADQHRDKRHRIIDQTLGSPEWADGWVGYWQDVLAENPSVVFPTLNNSGAFRQWIYESFRANKSFDRFATELILMERIGSGSNADSDASGFALATGNDAPMAMRSHVAMKAFAAVDMKCARCHDSPVDSFRQSDLFQLAAYLNDKALEVPATSVAAVGQSKVPGLITTSLMAGQVIEPVNLKAHWLDTPGPSTLLTPIRPGPRGELAALLTSPSNSRFSDVLVNRVWARLFGVGLIEPVDNWNDDPVATHPRLLQFLSSEFVRTGYDVKALVRRIVRSETWQSRDNRPRRMSAEQLVDSLFAAVGKDFRAETLGVHATDPGAVQLPEPKRAWQFAALPNERDRPALGMPVAQTIVDVLTVFGWNGSRQQPSTKREQFTSPLQPLTLFNGLVSQRIVRLSEHSAITSMCLQDIHVDALVVELFLAVLGRPPNASERDHFVSFLSIGFNERRTGDPPGPVEPLSTFQPDWRKHLEPEQTRLMLEAQQQVAFGEPPTRQLTADFRERVEDVLWALINSPEFVVIP